MGTFGTENPCVGGSIPLGATSEELTQTTVWVFLCKKVKSRK